MVLYLLQPLLSFAFCVPLRLTTKATKGFKKIYLPHSQCGKGSYSKLIGKNRLLMVENALCRKLALLRYFCLNYFYEK